MAMRCSRVGCGATAVASFCFDGRAALVWLDPLDPARGTGAGVLCARHADTLTPPRGWHLQDRRVASPRLWDDRPRPAPPPPRPRPVRAARPALGEAVAVRHDEAPPDMLPLERETLASPTPLAELLDARTPLLARAFGSVREVSPQQ
jgi:Protein of unknown function (DUF3499)